MSDEIANMGGRDLFASTRVEWHRKGELVAADITSAAEFLKHTGLDQRTVTVEPVYLKGEAEPVSGLNVTVSRWLDGTVQTYAGTGDRYGVMSDIDAFSLWDGFNFQAGGALYDARKVWATVAVDRETVLDPSGVADHIKMFGLVVNSHDGTSPLLFAATPVRVVCQNTLNMAMGSLSNVVKVRHTHTVSERASVLAQIMKQENAYLDAFEQEAATLYATAFSDKQYTNAVETMIGKAPAEDVKGSATKYENKRGLFMQAWQGKPNAGIRGTAWGAVNALTEANQYGRNVRKGDRGADAFMAQTMGLDGPTNTFRQGALALVKARAGLK